LEIATKYLSSSSYPTIGETRFIFLGIIEHLKTLAEDEDFQQSEIAALILQKIETYWMLMDRPSTVSAILDPRNKLSIFTDQLVAREHIQSIYETYKECSSSFTDSQIARTPRRTRQYFAKLRRGASRAEVSSHELNSSSTVESSELERYLEFPIDEEIEPLLWWQAHSSEFPIISDMARDFLTIQATSVASEQAFSVAGNTITKTRNRLLPETARACLCMKSWLSNDLIKMSS
jgi:hypothetical protein